MLNDLTVGLTVQSSQRLNDTSTPHRHGVAVKSFYANFIDLSDDGNNSMNPVNTNHSPDNMTDNPGKPNNSPDNMNDSSVNMIDNPVKTNDSLITPDKMHQHFYPTPDNTNDSSNNRLSFCSYDKIKNNKSTTPKNYSFEFSHNNTSIDQSSGSMTSSLYEWRTFNENCAKLIAEPNLIMKADEENHSKSSGDVEILQDLFRENICTLYNDIIDALNTSDTDQSDIDALGGRYDKLLQRTSGILAQKMPNLAQEINNKLLSVRTLLNALAEATPCIPNVAGCTHLKNFRIWLQMETDKLKHVSEYNNLDTIGRDQLKELFYYQQALQSEIERDGRILLEAAQKEINENDSGFTTTTASSSTTNCASTNSDTEGAGATNQNQAQHQKVTNNSADRKRRILFSLETRWKRLRLSALEYTVYLEAKLEQGGLLESHLDKFCDEPPSKKRCFNSQNQKIYHITEYGTSTPIATTISHTNYGPINNNSNVGTCLENANSLVSSISSDIIPFPDHEYEPFMDSLTNRKTSSDHVTQSENDTSTSSPSPILPLVDDNGNFILTDQSTNNDENDSKLENPVKPENRFIPENRLLENSVFCVDSNNCEPENRVKPDNRLQEKPVFCDDSNDIGYSSEHISSTDENCYSYANEDKVTCSLSSHAKPIDNTNRHTGNVIYASETTGILRELQIPPVNYSGTGISGTGSAKSGSNWSASSSPSLERRHRIHNSPIKDYYKMLPDVTIDTDSDAVGLVTVAQPQNKNQQEQMAGTDNSNQLANCQVPVSEDAQYVYTTKFFNNGDSNHSPNNDKSEMTDSLVVNVSKSKENLNDEALLQIVAMMDESFERSTNNINMNMKNMDFSYNNNNNHNHDFHNSSAEIRLDTKMSEIFNAYDNNCQNVNTFSDRANNSPTELTNQSFHGTTWKPFLDSKPNLNMNINNLNMNMKHNSMLIDNDETSNDAGSELSLDENNPLDCEDPCLGQGQGQIQGQRQARFRASKTSCCDLPLRRSRQHFDGTSCSSLKRRWQRPTTEISAPKALNWSSEMTLPNYYASNYDSLPSSSAASHHNSHSTNHRSSRRRLKLKARRLPRSISDSEHLSVLALCQRSARQSLSRSNVAAPPCTPCYSSCDSLSPAPNARPDQSEDEDDEAPPHLEGAGESLFILNDQRMAGDGNSTVSGSADQSDSIYYEWDDYKPPNHNECGPPDNPLDDSKLTEFGDDYRSWIDSAPPSARSDVSECVTNSPYLRRLSPVGGSKNENLIHNFETILRKSARNLKIARRNFIKRKNYRDLLAQCQREINSLNLTMEQMANKKSASQVILRQATRLAREWKELQMEINQIFAPKSDLIGSTVHRFTESLKLLKKQLEIKNLSYEFSTRAKSSIDVLFDEVSALKDVQDKIELDRIELKHLLNNKVYINCKDLLDLSQVYKSFSEKCDQQLAEFDNLQTTLKDWKNCEQILKNLINRIQEKLDKNRFFDTFSTQPEIFFDKNLENQDFSFEDDHSKRILDLKALRCDIRCCEERLNVLETMCNQLTSVQCDQFALRDRLLVDLRRCQLDHKSRLDALKKKVAHWSENPLAPPLDSTLLADEEMVISATPLSNTCSSSSYWSDSPMVLLQQALISQNDDDEAEEEEEELTEAELFNDSTQSRDLPMKNKQFSLANANNKKNFKAKLALNNRSRLERSRFVTTAHKFSRVFRYSLPLQFCLVALCLGLYFVHPDACSKVSNWNWSFGFRLDYVGNPPPT